MLKFRLEEFMEKKDFNPNNPVYLPTYEGCYVCGQTHPRGLRLRFFVGENNQVHARFLPDNTQTGYADIVHGGVISALLDELIGWAVSLNHDFLAYTAELTVRFVKPMPSGHSYLATAWIGFGRGKYWEGKGNISDEHGQVYAKGHGKYLLLSTEQTAEVAEKLTYQPDDWPVFRRKMKEEQAI
ncbi:MAG: PaaI family thioesterase [Spirochaetota bacterium]